MIDRLAVHLDRLDVARMNQQRKLLFDLFCEDYHSGDLESAACAARHRAHEGYHQNDRLRQLRPVVDVADAEAGGGDDRRNVEKALVDGGAEIVVEARHLQNVDGDHQSGDGDNAEVVPKLLKSERLLELSSEYQDINREIDAEKHHKDGDNCLLIARGICRHIVVVYAEAAGSGV